MSVDTMPRLAGYDGSGQDRDWHLWGAELDGTVEAVQGGRAHSDFIDLGRAAILAGNERLPGLAADFATNRIALAPSRMPSTIGRW